MVEERGWTCSEKKFDTVDLDIPDADVAYCNFEFGINLIDKCAVVGTLL